MMGQLSLMKITPRAIISNSPRVWAFRIPCWSIGIMETFQQSLARYKVISRTLANSSNCIFWTMKTRDTWSWIYLKKCKRLCMEVVLLLCKSFRETNLQADSSQKEEETAKAPRDPQLTRTWGRLFSRVLLQEAANKSIDKSFINLPRALWYMLAISH